MNEATKEIIFRYTLQGKVSIWEMMCALDDDFDAVAVWDPGLAPVGRHVHSYKAWGAHGGRLQLFPDLSAVRGEKNHLWGKIRSVHIDSPCKISDGNLIVRDEWEELMFGFEKKGERINLSSWVKALM